MAQQVQVLVVAQNDFMARIASGEIAPEYQRKKLLDAYAEELLRRYPVVILF